MTDHEHPDETGCPICEGDPEYLAALKARIVPLLEERSTWPTVTIPPGLSREDRRAFLRAHPNSMIATSQMSREEFRDWLDDDGPEGFYPAGDGVQMTAEHATEWLEGDH